MLLLKQNKTHNIRARRTAVSGYDPSSSTLGLPEPQITTSYSSLPHWKDFEVCCCTVHNSAIVIKTIPSNWCEDVVMH